MRLPDPLRSCAVLIGTSRYQSAELEDLPAVARNLTALRDLLTDPALGGLQPARCVVLADSTDVHKVWTQLRRMAGEATDTLLVYFAGHGLLEPHHNELFLALAGSHPPDLPAGAIPFEWIRRLFLNCAATYGVLVLDCCYSGRAATGHLGSAEDAILGQIDIKGTYTITAAGANQLALTLPGEEHTAFTGELLTLVRDGIADGPELLTYATIYRHLLRRLSARGLPQPHQLNRGTAEDLALARNPVHPRNTRRPPSQQRTSHSLAATQVAEISVKPRAVDSRMFAFSADSSVLVVATATNTVRIFDAPTWHQRIGLRQNWLGGARIYKVSCSPLGDKFATAGVDVKGVFAIQLWSMRTASRLHRIGVDASVHGLAFSRDGTWLATSDNNGRVDVWDTLRRKVLIRVSHNAEVRGVAFSPDGRQLATGSGDRTARIWDAYTGESKAVLAHDYDVRSVSFSPDGRLLATASTPVLIWDVQTGLKRVLSPNARADVGRLCHDLTFSPDGRFLAAAFIDHTARVWDVSSGGEVLTLAHDHEVRAVEFSPDGRWLATGSGPWEHEGREGVVRVWQLSR